MAAVLAQTQPFREEEEVELASFGSLGEVQEGRELNLAPRRWVAPNGCAVDAGKVRGKMDLFHDVTTE
jgi:hypothetical protein